MKLFYPFFVVVAVVAMVTLPTRMLAASYSQNMYLGLKSTQVAQLQQDLAKDPGIYPQQLVTGFFGRLTLQAVKLFQAKYGIWQTGFVGPLTRAKLNELYDNGSTTAAGDITKGVGQQEGSFLIQKINANSVDGLWYQKYPLETLNGTPKTITVGDNIGYACEGISEIVVSINAVNQTVTFHKVTSKPPLGGCPL